MDRTSRLAADRGPLGIYSDAARRLSDQVALHLAAEGFNATGRWIAARLSDGGTDGVLYPNRATAVRHQLHETQCAYLIITPDGITPQGAEIFLNFNRGLYDNNFRMSDPDMDAAPRIGDY